MTIGLVIVLAGHVFEAYAHPQARAAMRSGLVDARYARQQHPAWVAELTAEAAPNLPQPTAAPAERTADRPARHAR
jgi:formate dehydrogenase subunit gamma